MVAGPVAAGVAVIALIVFIVWRRRKRAANEYGARP